MSAALPLIPRQNNIGALRLIFACVVMLFHLGAVTDIPDLIHLRLFNADFAVRAFFVLSGFLIVMSYEHSTNADDYFGKRIRRIYPAYAAVVLLCAFGGYFLSTAPEYFTYEWLRYVASNLVFLNFYAPELPGVFTHNPMSEVNGALWTIKIEVLFYALVPMLVLFLRGRYRLAKIIAIFVAAYGYRYVCHQLGYDKLAHQMPGQMMYFIVGVAAYYYFDWVKAHQKEILVGAIAALLTVVFWPFANVPQLIAYILGAADHLAVSALVILLAFSSYWGNVEKYGDFSYGIYIWHFPVIQALVALGVFVNPYAGALAAIGITLLLAILSWRLVERPALRPSSHYIQATA